MVLLANCLFTSLAIYQHIDIIYKVCRLSTKVKLYYTVQGLHVSRFVSFGSDMYLVESH
jgi:hypothetical protein